MHVFELFHCILQDQYRITEISIFLHIFFFVLDFHRLFLKESLLTAFTIILNVSREAVLQVEV